MSATADLIRAGMHPGEATSLDRDDAIKLIREALKKRSGKAWSVSGGSGTAWGWISVQAPPRRRVAHIPNPDYSRSTEADCRDYHPQPCADCPPAYFEGPPEENHGGWYTSEAECQELAELFGLNRPVHCQGLSIPAASDYRRFYVAAARGLVPVDAPQPYWD